MKSGHLALFVDRLIKDKDITFTRDSFYRTHQREVVEFLHTVLRTKLLHRLNSQQQAHLTRLIEKGTSDRQIQSYVLSQIPDALSYLTHVLLHFRLHYLSKPHPHTHKNVVHVGSSAHKRRKS